MTMQAHWIWQVQVSTRHLCPGFSFKKAFCMLHSSQNCAILMLHSCGQWLGFNNMDWKSSMQPAECSRTCALEDLCSRRLSSSRQVQQTVHDFKVAVDLAHAISILGSRQRPPSRAAQPCDQVEGCYEGQLCDHCQWLGQVVMKSSASILTQ